MAEIIHIAHSLRSLFLANCETVISECLPCMVLILNVTKALICHQPGHVSNKKMITNPQTAVAYKKKRLKSTMISTEILHHFAGYVNGMKMYGVMSELELRAHWIIF